MKVKVKIKNYKGDDTKCVPLLEKMILNKKAELSSINQKIRIDNTSLYIMALRLAREENSVGSYIKALDIMKTDILCCKNKIQKEHLKKIFEDYLELNLFQGVKQHFQDISNS